MFDFNFTDLNEITMKLKNEIQKNFEQTPAIYDLWFNEMSVLRMTDKIIFVSVLSEIQKKTIENKYKNLITDAVKKIYYGLNLPFVIIYHTQDGSESIKITKEQMDYDEKRTLLDDIVDIEDNPISRAVKKPAAQTNQNTQIIQPNQTSNNLNNLNKIPENLEDMARDDLESDTEIVKNLRYKYTFKTFVVGSSNRFAYKASANVAQYPAVKYNPFFIYGPSGLGKTHLLCAIYNEYERRFKNMKVLYVNGVEFANELIDFITENNRKKAQIFRDKYRNCDMLLIDDIQFIAGKFATQEEIFHTFNVLYEAGKQIIFTSDRPPKDINPLEERIKSRFESGLIVDIQPPDMELRIAILKRKSEDMGINITNDVLFFLAENVSSNIRQMEGTIKKLNAYSYLNNSEITLDLAKSSITDILSGTEPINVTVEKVLAAVSQTFGVPQTEFKNRKRTKEIALARNVAIYIIRNITDLSLPAIGKIFGRDHSTVFSAVGVIENEIETNTILSNQINDISNMAKG